MTMIALPAPGAYLLGEYSAPVPFIYQPQPTTYALDLRGPGSYLALTANPAYNMGENGLSDFTLEAWVKGGAGAYGWVIYHFDPNQAGASAGFGLYITFQGLIALRLADGVAHTRSTNCTMPQDLFQETWRHIAGVRRTVNGDTQLGLYFDGVQLRGFPGVHQPFSVASTSLLSLGAPTVDGYRGLVRQVRVWTRALASDELAAGLDTSPHDRTGLVGEWLFADGAPTDSSATANTGQLVGGATIVQQP